MWERNKYPIFYQKFTLGENLFEPNFWEIAEPLPNLILDIPPKSLEKENNESKPTESESDIISLSEKKYYEWKKIKPILSLWFMQGIISLEEVKTN